MQCDNNLYTLHRVLHRAHALCGEHTHQRWQNPHSGALSVLVLDGSSLNGFGLGGLNDWKPTARSDIFTLSVSLCVRVEVCALSLSTPCHCFTCSGISTPCQLQLFLQSWGVALRLAQVAHGHQCTGDNSQILISVQPKISSNVMAFVVCAIWNKQSCPNMLPCSHTCSLALSSHSFWFSPPQIWDWFLFQTSLNSHTRLNPEW